MNNKRVNRGIGVVLTFILLFVLYKLIKMVRKDGD